ncbi:ParB/RepB/Spo0J family partition protein [Nesterenkonia rhizosphaerae]|uniref:ParB-like N-terminal domain-containing protein n=1 Tax=Nesterenkonia rhizosphaerae TaxID=1348272 RepID=A0ABP9FU16_9MICC
MAETTNPTKIHEAIQDLAVSIDDLEHYVKNPRQGDLNVIMQSLEVNGQYRPIVVNKGTHTGRPNEILAGNHTVKAAKELGWTHVAATYVDVNDADAARIVAVDNRANDVSGYDDEELAELLGDINASEGGLDGTGFTSDDLDELLAGINPDELEGEEDAEGGDDSLTSFTITCPPELRQRFADALDSYGGETRAENLGYLLDAHPRHG